MLGIAKRSTVGILCMVMIGLCLSVVGCDKLRNGVGNDVQSTEENMIAQNPCCLKGTHWKLVGIVNAQIGDTTELEPKDCAECYTLIFDTDSTFITNSTVIGLHGNYRVDCSTHSFQITEFGGDKRGEVGGGASYSNPFWNRSIQFFFLQEDVLMLYYNDNQNYLQFELQ